jgi:hypothetical protein
MHNPFYTALLLYIRVTHVRAPGPGDRPSLEVSGPHAAAEWVDPCLTLMLHSQCSQCVVQSKTSLAASVAAPTVPWSILPEGCNIAVAIHMCVVQDIESALSSAPAGGYKLVTVTHVDTSTGEVRGAVPSLALALASSPCAIYQESHAVKLASVSLCLT